jgi:bidirectional [NiFe] hydrogenase diaphorase subunit
MKGMSNNGMVTVEINGKKASVPEGTTVLQAARGLGIDIPTLCYHEALSMYAACRVCIVEMSIEKGGRKRTWIDASCVYPVQNGLIISTDSPKVKKERKLIIELLLSRAPESRVLNELADRYGAQKGRFESIDKGESNCILCGLCVRVCNEMIHSEGIGTAFRGINKKVVTPFKIAQDVCVGCAACAYVCPTGAIKVIENDRCVSIENWHAEVEIKLCRECGRPIGPKLYLEQIEREVPVKKEIFDLCPACRRKVFKVK